MSENNQARTDEEMINEIVHSNRYFPRCELSTDEIHDKVNYSINISVDVKDEGRSPIHILTITEKKHRFKKESIFEIQQGKITKWVVETYRPFKETTGRTIIYCHRRCAIQIENDVVYSDDDKNFLTKYFGNNRILNFALENKMSYVEQIINEREDGSPSNIFVSTDTNPLSISIYGNGGCKITRDGMVLKAGLIDDLAYNYLKQLLEDDKPLLSYLEKYKNPKGTGENPGSPGEDSR